MSRQDRFIRYLMKHGTSASTSIITGTQCPCMISRRGSSYPEYSKDWHRRADNIGAEDCNGTGLIDTTTTTTNILAILQNSTQSPASFLTKEIIDKIGELQRDDMLMVGQCETDGTFFDISDLSEQSDRVINFNSRTFAVRHYFDIHLTDQIGQVSLLKRIT